MIVTAYILLACFGFFNLMSGLKFLRSGLSILHGVLWFISIFITAISAGVIWGGLYQ
ncbi:hypothetical protein [Bacillus pumilus]|uniref:hypothetical protein n=1 Tax=Bacillus pumilus TaxID=1408 RepID=UPI001642AAC1|nr:hypothetical protein [Bacillus pumilus]